ncbi:hypothetical protein D043_4476B, partial [Vibrio parahaemolyticus EKP-021]
GSWRKKVRRTRENVRSILLLICTCVIRGKRYSTGSSAVMIFLPGSLSSLNAP